MFIRFEGVNITALVSLNGTKLGEHKGGYAAFIYELTDHLLYEQTNKLEVTVSNEENLEVIPLVGDFNNYGGIYRPVQLIVTEPVCITPLDYASPGIYISQKNVSDAKADIEVLTKLSNGTGSEAEIVCKTTIFNAADSIIATNSTSHTLTNDSQDITHTFTIDNPHLWNGKADPYMYQVRVEILQNARLIDGKTEPLGIRYFHVDANDGFFLNGKAMSLRGVSRHQDKKDKASAISDADHRQDMALMLEMGINALRLAHYQHAEIVYDLTDSAGVVVWAELPWVGAPGGFLSNSNGYEDTEEFKSISKQQLYELIRQNYNHPSILMWSIFNEIQNPEGAEPTDFIVELNDIVKKEDPGRLSVGASMLNPNKHVPIHDKTDLIAWNRYFGWYYQEPADMATFLDQLHLDFPEYKIGISEYGAGGSIYQHSEKLERPNPMGTPHPEEWQSYYHEEHLKIFDDRPFVWGTFVWNMFDFGSHFRKEGDHHGINDKGLVTYDRKTRKDAFYFYKANWSDEPVLHITSSRFRFRSEPTTSVKVYTNLNDVSLTVNGRLLPTKSPEKGIIVWDNVQLDEGNNGIIVRATAGGKNYVDDCVWAVEKPFAGMNLVIKVFDFVQRANTVAIVGVALAVFIWLFGIRALKRRARFRRILYWTFFWLLIVVSALVLLAKYFINNGLGN